MNNNPSQDGLSLNTVDEKGQAPGKRISTAKQSLDLHKRFEDADQQRSMTRARVKGMLDGNPPYDSAKLKNLGQGHRCNLNFREGKAIADAAKTPYYDLFQEVPTYATVETKSGDDQSREQFNRVISQEFHNLLERWDGFDYNIQLKQKEMVVNGIGPIFWQDATDWRFRAARIGNVKVPDQTECDPERWEIVEFTDALKAHELFAKIKDEKTAKELGWNVDACKRAITKACQDKSSANTSKSWEYYQDLFKNNDLYTGLAESATIEIAHQFVKEFSGKVTHLMVSVSPEIDDFLFEGRERFESFRRAMCVFFFDIGDGTWHSVKGLGTEIFPMIEVKNRLECQKVDSGFLGSSLIVQAKDANAAHKAQLLTVGPLTIAPPGLEFQQNVLGSASRNIMEVTQSMDNILANNTGTYRQRQETNAPDKTATGERIEQMERAVLNKGAVNRYYTQMDKMYSEIYRRASNPNLTEQDPGGKEALEFQQACIEQGVPKEALVKVKKVKANRNVGQGSPALRGMALGQLMQALPVLSEDGRQNVIEDYVANLTGQSKVNRYVPPKAKQALPTEDDSEAALENAALKMGCPVIWNPRQNNVRHSQIHLQSGSAAAQALQQGANPIETLSFLKALGPHLAVHIQEIGKDKTRSGTYQILHEQFQQLAAITDQLQANVQQQQQAQQEEAQASQAAQQTVSEDFQVKSMKAQGELELKKQKAMADIQLKAEKQGAQLALKDASTAAGIAMKQQSNTANIVMDKQVQEAQTTTV